MRAIYIVVFIIFLTFLFSYINRSNSLKITSIMKIESREFNEGNMIPKKFTCDGQGVSPELEISGVPAEAKSLALIMSDPDAPRGTFVHWTAWNIPPTTSQISEGAKDFGQEGLNSANRRGYFGPCPPSGTHRYYFKIYALDTILDLDTNANKETLVSAMNGHILNEAEVMGQYNRE